MTEINTELENADSALINEAVMPKDEFGSETAELAAESEEPSAAENEGGEPAPNDEGAIDYPSVIEADIKELRSQFPELRDLERISELKNPMRFAALRDLGLSATEAYLATSMPQRTYDNRAHLTASVPGSAGVASEMSHSEYAIARDIFTELSDSEIRKLYRKVTK